MGFYRGIGGIVFCFFFDNIAVIGTFLFTFLLQNPAVFTLIPYQDGYFDQDMHLTILACSRITVRHQVTFAAYEHTRVSV